MSWRDLMYAPGFGGGSSGKGFGGDNARQSPPPPPLPIVDDAVDARKKAEVGKKKAGSSDRPLAGSETLLSDVSGVKGPLAPSPKVY